VSHILLSGGGRNKPFDFLQRRRLRETIICFELVWFVVFEVDVASETKMVLDAFLRVVGHVGRSLPSRALDCQSFANVACFGVDCAPVNLVCRQELQRMD
jgi:hypothetical protein